MKKIGCFALCLCLVLGLAACPQPEAEPETVQTGTQYAKIQPVGQVPEEFQPVVEENLLRNICVSGDSFFRVEVAEGCYRIEKYDSQLRVTASCNYTPMEVLLSSASDAFLHAVSRIGDRLLATSDGGFLFTVVPTYKLNQVNGTANSYVVKCGADGTIQWQYNAGDMGSQGLEFPVELDGCYYLIGTVETQPGERYTDACILQLDADGGLIRKENYGGSDFDWVDFCRVTDGGLEVWISSLSQDGDFSASPDGYVVDVVAQVGPDLELQSFRLTKDSTPDPKGTLHAETVYAGEGILKDFSCGAPSAVIDCGEQYLIISENITGIYPDQPLYISAIWYLTETVYSAYDKSGNLLWRAAVDSSPDYGSSLAIMPSETGASTTASGG